MRSPKNRVTSIGLELEGGWLRSPPGLKHDGSVQRLTAEYRGEICSAPFTNIVDAEKWLKLHYPQEVNNTCGFHVHIGLPELHYSRLMDRDFEAKFLSSMEDFWNKYRAQPGFDLFRSRLDGQNQYCQKQFRPEQQLFQTAAYGDRACLPRYSQLNFCYGRHGTLECRLFPCFPLVDHAVEGMKTFVTSVNEFLSTCKPSRPVSFSVTTDEVETVIMSKPARLAAV